METENVVIGTGPLGLAVMRALRAKGHQPVMVNRSGKVDDLPTLQVTRADVSDVRAVKRVCKNAGTIFYCAKPPYTQWVEEFPPLIDALLQGVPSPECKIVYLDNLYAYGPMDGPLTENAPLAAQGRKGRTRAELDERLLEAHSRGVAKVTIARASDFFGPHVKEAALGSRAFEAALKGAPAEVLGNIDTPHTHAFIDDIAAGMLTLADHEEAFGRAWHLPAAPPITTREFLTRLYAQVGKPFKFRAAPRALVSVLGLFMSQMREVKEVLYTFEQPFVVDHSQFEKAFGAKVTPHDEAIARTLAWFREHVARRARTHEPVQHGVI
jgi:nucleoside-diphosphate-sugar epimerase